MNTLLSYSTLRLINVLDNSYSITLNSTYLRLRDRNSDSIFMQFYIHNEPQKNIFIPILSLNQFKFCSVNTVLLPSPSSTAQRQTNELNSVNTAYYTIAAYSTVNYPFKRLASLLWSQTLFTLT